MTDLPGQSATEPTGPDPRPERGSLRWPVGGALLAIFPIFFLAALWNGFQELSLRSLEEEARRLLLPTAARIGEAAEAPTVLNRIFAQAYPNGIPPFNESGVAAIVERLRHAYAPFLHSLDRGFRLYLLAPRGPANIPYDLCYPAPSPEGERISAVWHGREADFQIREGKTQPSWQETATRGRAALSALYGHQPTLGELNRTDGFSLRVATRHASATYLCLDRSVFESRKYKIGVHLEIDGENIRPRIVWNLALGETPAEVSCAMVLREDGQPIAQVVRPPFVASQTFPVPTQEGEVEAFAEGLFLKTTVQQTPPRVVVVGIARPWFTNPPGPWAKGIQVWLLTAFLMAGWNLGRRMSRPEGLGWPLTWQLGAAFAFGAMVPGLILGYFGLTRFLESGVLWENHWRNTIRRVLQEGDRGIVHRMDRLQRDFDRWKDRLTHLPPERISQDRDLNSSRRVVLFYLDRQERLWMNARAWSEYGQKNQTISRVAKMFLHDFLSYRREGRGETAEEGPPPPQKLELGVEELVGEKFLFHPFYLHSGRVVTADTFGETTTGYVDEVLEPDGRLRGVMLAMIANAEVAWAFHSRHRKEPPRSGVLRGSLLFPEVQPAFFRNVPFLGDLAERAFRSRTIQSAEGFIHGIPFLIEVLASTFLPNQRLVGITERARLDESHQQDLWFIGGEMLIGLFTLLTAIFLIRRLFLHPVLHLRRGALEVVQGRFSARLSPQGSDELGGLCLAFNRMAEGLEHRERMRRFVSAGVWREVGREESTSTGSARRVEAAVLFADLRNFTGISEGLRPDEVIRLMNGYFTAMDALIRRNGGQIDKFIGDAILAVFLPMEGAPSPCHRATVAGLSMRARLSHLNRQRVRDGGFPLENGVGIHFGSFVEARIGSRTGRRDLTVLGREVGRAMRLEAASKKATRSRVVVSPAVAERLGGDFPLWPFESEEGPCFEIERPWQGSSTPGSATP